MRPCSRVRHRVCHIGHRRRGRRCGLRRLCCPGRFDRLGYCRSRPVCRRFPLRSNGRLGYRLRGAPRQGRRARRLRRRGPPCNGRYGRRPRHGRLGLRLHGRHRAHRHGVWLHRCGAGKRHNCLLCRGHSLRNLPLARKLVAARRRAHRAAPCASVLRGGRHCLHRLLRGNGLRFMQRKLPGLHRLRFLYRLHGLRSLCGLRSMDGPRSLHRPGSLHGRLLYRLVLLLYGRALQRPRTRLHRRCGACFIHPYQRWTHAGIRRAHFLRRCGRGVPALRRRRKRRGYTHPRLRVTQRSCRGHPGRAGRVGIFSCRHLPLRHSLLPTLHALSSQQSVTMLLSP